MKPLTEPPKKIDQLRALMASGQWERAISFASRFPVLGDHKEEITRAQGCITNPRFFAQLGFDPADCIAAGKDALIARYSK